MTIGQSIASAADPIISTEHGIVGAVVLALNVIVGEVRTYLRKKKRGDTLKDEVRAILTDDSDLIGREVARQMGLRAMQDSERWTRLEGNAEAVSEKLDEIEARCEETKDGLSAVNTRLNQMHIGILKLVAAIKPELVASLDLGNPS